MRAYQGRIGDHIKTTLERMVQVANESADQVMADFNGIPVVVKPGDDPVALYEQWQADRIADHERLNNA